MEKRSPRRAEVVIIDEEKLIALQVVFNKHVQRVRRDVLLFVFLVARGTRGGGEGKSQRAL